MRITINKTTLMLIEGDITLEKTEAIVNAANSRLAGGAGVDGAIHAAGGPSIMLELKKYGGCQTGHAVITKGGNLKAKYVIHAVGPVYQGGGRNESALLRSAYWESIRLAESKALKSISFPAISAGIYGYPLHEAASIALKAIIDYLRGETTIELVRFVLFGKKTYDIFVEELNKLT
jgi:O-acetyl-ADP-ribose deacetylase (regulator of RNase III)